LHPDWGSVAQSLVLAAWAIAPLQISSASIVANMFRRSIRATLSRREW
jgi:hypothetical protein